MCALINTGYLSAKINGINVNTSVPTDESNYSRSDSRTVNYIVIHYTGNKQADKASSNAAYFQGQNRSASAHFFVDDSHIYQTVKLNCTAWHCGCKSGYKRLCRNANSIGIEMCCTAGNYTVSETTQINAAFVCAYLCKMLSIKDVDTYVLRHYDVVASNKSCPKQYVEDPAQWERFKGWVKNILSNGSTSSGTDPGKLYRVYCGSYTNVTNAQAQVSRLKAAGFASLVKHYDLKYRVQVAACKKEENAKDIQKRLKEKGYDSFTEYE